MTKEQKWKGAKERCLIIASLYFSNSYQRTFVFNAFGYAPKLKDVRFTKNIFNDLHNDFTCKDVFSDS